MDKNEDRTIKNKVREKIQGVSMLPFGLIAGFAGEKEIRIIELAENGFTFRTAEKIADPELFRVCFYHYPKLEYEQVELHSYTLECSGEYEFYYEYTLYLDHIKNKDIMWDSHFIDDNDSAEFIEYRKQVQYLLGWYDRYIRMKLLGDSEELASFMTAYPEGGDVVTARDFEEQKKAWFFRETKEIHRDEKEVEAEKAKKTVQDAKQKLKTGLEVGSESPVSEYALELDNPWLYEEYLSKDLTTFMENYWKRNYLSGHWLSDHFPQRLYIGNSFCHLLFPKEDQLFQLLEKARKESLQVTLTFSYIREFMLENTGQLIEKLENWCEENKVILEIQVNDWAMAEMLKGKSLLVPALGILLNKRRKDPRLHYKTGTMEQIGADADKYLSENNLNADFYREYLKTETMAQIGAETESKFLEENSLNADFYRKYLEKEYGIVRYEWESCGYDMALPPGKNSLHLPFYQTNTSQYCTLYAKCMTGERGKQKLAEECPKFCKDYAFLYPDHLMMIGRYNSLFALDSRIFEDGSGSGTGTEIGTKIKTEEILKKWKKAGVDRLVVNLLDPGVKR